MIAVMRLMVVVISMVVLPNVEVAEGWCCGICMSDMGKKQGEEEKSRDVGRNVELIRAAHIWTQALQSRCFVNSSQMGEYTVTTVKIRVKSGRIMVDDVGSIGHRLNVLCQQPSHLGLLCKAFACLWAENAADIDGVHPAYYTET